MESKLKQIKHHLYHRGFTLLEVLIALAIVSILSVGYLGALTNSSRAAMQTDQMDTGRVLAQHQMEYVKQAAFAASYTPLTISQSTYPGYSAAITVESVNYDSAIQKITVTITCGSKTVATLEDYKTQ